jgi:lipoprotein-releasing system permease protein
VKAALVLRIAWRQLLSRSSSGFVRTVSVLSVAGIAIGVAALLILNAFMDGFADTIMEQLTSIHPPLEVRAPGGYTMTPEDIQYTLDLAESDPRISGVSPVLERTVVAAGSSGDVAGVHLRGIDWTLEPALVAGPELEGLHVSPPGAVIGTTLAARLGVAPGDTMRLASTDAASFSSMGRLLVDTIVAVRVAAVLDMGIDEYNSGVVITDLGTAAALFSTPVAATSLSLGTVQGAEPVSMASGITLALREAYIEGECGYMVCDAFISLHGNLFAALGLEKTGMMIVLALITVVALLNLLSALTMIALEHRRDSGVLRAMGASPRTMMAAGLAQGGMIGMAGASAGCLFASASVAIINRFFPIRLESSVYWIDTLPGEIDLQRLLLVGGITILACLAASVIPTASALAVSPSMAVRYE